MPDITVASTTDSEEDVKAAVLGTTESEVELLDVVDEPSEEGEKPSTEAESEPAKPKGEEPKKAAASESAQEQEEEDEEERPKGRTKLQRRIDDLTREKYDLRDELRELRTKLDQVNKGNPKPSIAETPKANEKPIRASFKTDDDYLEALVDWKADQKIARVTEESQRQVNDAQLQEVFDGYNAGAASFRSENPDFDEVVGDSNLVINPVVQQAIIFFEGEGPAIAYHLAKNPELVEKLNGMSSSRAVAEIGAIHSRLFSEEPEPKPAPPVKVKPKVLKAPEPAKPIRTSAPTSAVPLDEMSFQDYRRVRDTQERGRVRR